MSLHREFSRKVFETVVKKQTIRFPGCCRYGNIEFIIVPGFELNQNSKVSDNWVYSGHIFLHIRATIALKNKFHLAEVN